MSGGGSTWEMGTTQEWDNTHTMGHVVGYVWDGWAGMDEQAAGKEEVGVFRGRTCEASSGQSIRCLPLPILPNLLLGHLCLPPAEQGRCQPTVPGALKVQGRAF